VHFASFAISNLDLGSTFHGLVHVVSVRGRDCAFYRLNSEFGCGVLDGHERAEF
jgi:hypothetical protein